jgi:hypothetical protein
MNIRMGLLTTVLLLSGLAFGQAEPNKGRGITVVGTVVDFSGRPWKDALIRLETKERPDPKSGPTIIRRAKTNSDGRYSFVGLPVGVYLVYLESVTPALREFKEVPTLPAGSTFEADFGYEVGSIGECPLHFVIGRVTDARSSPLMGAKVSVLNAFNQRRVLSAKTDKDGIYKIGLCNSGQYIVFVNTPHVEVSVKTVSFEPNETSKRVDFSVTLLP